jgi:cation:H+ antiporter
MNLELLPTGAHVLIVVVAILAMAKGADVLVDAASRVALRLGVSELVIGLTVVSMGTSAPEFFVTVMAAFQGKGDISVGNIVGSNIFNLGFILGGCALFHAIRTSPALFFRDGAVLGSTTVLLCLMIGIDLRLDRHDGAILMVIMVLYLMRLYRDRAAGIDEEVLQEVEAEEHESAEEVLQQHSLGRDAAFLVLGLGTIVVASEFMLGSAVHIARVFGLSEWVIGVTIVAAGTSAPEFVTSFVAVLKGRHDIGAGNLVGSDIFNLLGILGLAGVLQPVAVEPAARISLLALCGMVFLALFFIRTGWQVSRLEGGILLLVAMARWAFDFSAH